MNNLVISEETIFEKTIKPAEIVFEVLEAAERQSAETVIMKHKRFGAVDLWKIHSAKSQFKIFSSY
jgi:hypothetical protein